MTSSRPDSSITVITMFAPSDSEIPRRFSAATSARNTSAAGTAGTSTNCVRYSPLNANANPPTLTSPAASMQKPTTKDTRSLR